MDDAGDEGEHVELMAKMYEKMRLLQAEMESGKNAVDNQIKGIEEALSNKIDKLTTIAKSYYESESNIETNKLAQILCQIEKMSDRAIVIKDKVDSSLEKILEDFL